MLDSQEMNCERYRIKSQYGNKTNPETTTGGNALKFYASMRFDVRRAQSISKDNNDATSIRTKVRIVKNKVAVPFRTAEFDIEFGKGICKVFEVLDIGSQLGVITKRGAFYSYGETRLGQGRENAKGYLEEHPDLLQEVEAQVRARMLTGEVQAPTEEPEPGEEEN